MAENVFEIGQTIVAAKAHVIAEEGQEQSISHGLRDDGKIHTRHTRAESEPAKNKGKKPEMMEKIIAGGMKAYAKENCLLEQAYVHDTSKTVAQAVKDAEGAIGGPVKVTGFVRYALGEGIDKKEEDFGDEVRKLAGGG